MNHFSSSENYGVGPDRYMTISGRGGQLRYSPISVHALHVNSARTTVVQEWAISVQFLDHFGT